MLDGRFVDEQSHALLTLVGNDFLGTQGLVTDGQFVHVNQSTTLFYQLAEAVHVSGRTMVVDRDDGVVVLLAKGTHHVVGTLLHLCIGTLHGIQLDT